MSQVSLMGQSPLGQTPPTDGEDFRHRITDPPQPGWETWWLWASERINPIVVKEVRQSLKSKQFTISFGLTLIAAVSWTLIAISLMVPHFLYARRNTTAFRLLLHFGDPVDGDHSLWCIFVTNV